MSERIRTGYGLPLWFDIDNYAGVSELSVRVLAGEIKRRQRIFHSTDPVDKERLFRDIEDYPLISMFPSQDGLSYLEWSALFRSNDTCNKKSESPVLKSIGKSETRKDQDDNDRLLAELWGTSLLRKIQGIGVKPALSCDISCAISDDEVSRGFKLNLEHGWTRLDDLLKLSPYHTFGYLKIDFNVTDKELINGFKRLLPLYRKHLNVPEPSKKVTDDKIRLISQYGVIPYIDLMLWAEINDAVINQSVYAGALFPDFRYGECKLREAIIPLAMGVLEPQYLRTLQEKGVLENKKTKEKI